MRPLDLDGATVVVTGASRGIGAALVSLLVHEGARVIAVGRSVADLQALAVKHSGKVRPLAADLSLASEVDRVIADLRRTEPGLSVLVNNAAMQTELDPFSDDVIALARTELALDFEAPMVLAFGLLPLLAEKERAAIVNITSALAIVPKASAPVYCAAKAALANLSRTLRYHCEEKAPQLAVSEVVMALVDTDMTTGRGAGKISAESAAAHVLGAIRSGQPEVWVGKTKILQALHRLSPRLAHRLMRRAG